MITIAQIDELERASRYLLQQLTAAKNAITSLEAMEPVPEFHSPGVITIARDNVRRTEGFMLTAAEDLNKELNKLLPNSAAAVTQDFDERTS